MSKPTKPAVGQPVVYINDEGASIPGMISSVHTTGLEDGLTELETVTVAVLDSENGVDYFTADHSEDKPYRQTWRWVDMG